MKSFFLAAIMAKIQAEMGFGSRARDFEWNFCTGAVLVEEGVDWL